VDLSHLFQKAKATQKDPAMKSKTRLKLTLLAAIFLAAMAMISTVIGMEVMATTCIAGIMTILSTYIWAQTKRPSYYRNNDSDDEKPLIAPGDGLRIRSTVWPDGHVNGRENPDAESRE
jgi:hypothetical protein